MSENRSEFRIEKRSSKRVQVVGIDGDKTQYKFVGTEDVKSLKTIMFDKLFRALEDGESTEQITEEQSKAAVEEKTAAKSAEKEAKAKSAEEKAAAREAAKKAKLEALAAVTTDPNLKVEGELILNYRGNPTHKATCTGPKGVLIFCSEFSQAGKIAYTYCTNPDGSLITDPEMVNKGVDHIAKYTAEKLGVSEQALHFQLKNNRRDMISASKFTDAEIQARKAEIKAERLAAKPVPAPAAPTTPATPQA